MSRRRKKNRGRGKGLYILFVALTVAAILTVYNITAYRAQLIPGKAGFYEFAGVSLSLESRQPIEPPQVDIEALRDIGNLRSRYYSVDKKTVMDEALFNIDSLLSRDVHLKKSLFKPKVLIFHTHGHEMYADSSPGQGVIGAGEQLKNLLESRYGIKCLHITDRFDMVDGQLQILGAYERMEPRIRQVLAENPSIEMVIDLHRDGVNEGVRLVSRQNGKDCAKIMFFNGLCTQVDSQGNPYAIQGLENPYIGQNLALSLQAQMQAEQLYPGLNRKIYLNAYRYSLHFKGNSMLIELGAQTNTEAEVAEAVSRLSDIIYATVFS